MQIVCEYDEANDRADIRLERISDADWAELKNKKVKKRLFRKALARVKGVRSVLPHKTLREISVELESDHNWSEIWRKLVHQIERYAGLDQGARVVRINYDPPLGQGARSA